MAKSIEHKIRFKATIMYLIVAIGVIAMTIYLNTVSEEISLQRQEIEKQHNLLSATNNLIFTVGKAQSASNLYLSSKQRKHLKEYNSTVDTIHTIIDSIVAIKPREEEKLRKIEILLREKAQIITKVNYQFAKDNPVTMINKRLQDYETTTALKEDTVYVAKVIQDTVVTEAPKKNFLKRVGEVFRPARDSIKVVVNQRVDTVMTVKADSLPIISEVEDIAQKAQVDYEQNIRQIELQVSMLISSDRDISHQVSELLMEFHKEIIGSTLSITARSEESIKRNYRYSSLGGIVALILVFFFIILIIGDINKGREARRELEVANENVRKIMESRHKLLLSVSHDIKTPLNSIIGYTDMMRMDDNVRSMQSSAGHILSMLENLLEFSSLEQGTLKRSNSDFNLREMCYDIYDMFMPLAQQKGLVLTIYADDIRLNTDMVKLKQIIINLVSNSVKYTRSGTVDLNASFRDGRLNITVSDTGVGIPQEKISQLFKPFSRIEENNSLAEGTGLGMFVVKGLVELLEGEIEVTSIVDSGSTIKVAMMASRARREIPKGKKRIKVFDDDNVIKTMVSDMLNSLGHDVVESGQDIILTDMEMGDITGVDVLRDSDGIPVIIMTGRSDFTSDMALELGFDAFIAKPFTKEQLREIVGEYENTETRDDDDFWFDNKDEIMEMFRQSAADNFNLLESAIAADDFARAQATCHKMYPMFAQLGYPTDELRKMDSHRDCQYEEWQSDVKKILSIKV